MGQGTNLPEVTKRKEQYLFCSSHKWVLTSWIHSV